MCKFTRFRHFQLFVSKKTFYICGIIFRSYHNMKREIIDRMREWKKQPQPQTTPFARCETDRKNLGDAGVRETGVSVYCGV